MQSSKTRLLHDPQYIYAPQARAQTQESYISESGGAQAVSGSENWVKIKTIKDEGITFWTFGLSKSTPPFEITFGSSNTWGPSNTTITYLDHHQGPHSQLKIILDHRCPYFHLTLPISSGSCDK